MSPEQQKQFDEMYLFISQLKSSVTIPRDVETAFAERLGGLSVTGSPGSAGATTPISSFPFNLPANPSGTIPVLISGVTYNLLYK